VTYIIAYSIYIFHLDSLFGGVVVSSLSGKARRELSISKCPGVKTDMSEGSVERGVKGREFNIASIRTKTVFNSSNVSDT
jgi:hypothetical protein